MTSLPKMSVPISTLYEQLCSDIGGSFDPKRSDHSDEANSLKTWIRVESNKDIQTNSLVSCFEAAIQNWVGIKIEFLEMKKKNCSGLIELVSYAHSNFTSHSFLNQSAANYDQWNQEPIFEQDPTDSEFVLVDDGTDRQIAILNEWRQQPSRVLAALPRIKAAFDILQTDTHKR